MKENEKTKPTKKKILFYYLILAACILVIAAITVAVVFAVRTYPGELSAENGEQEQPDGDDGDNTDNTDNTGGDNTQTDGDSGDDNGDGGGTSDTSTARTFLSPVTNVEISQKQDFWYDQTLKMYYLHNGVDFAAEAGTQVVSSLDGTVTEVSVQDALYGGVITIEHDNGVTTVYRYVDPVESLKAGDKVSRGDVIGTVAAATGSENAEGAHLHFEVYANGTLADPEDYLGTEK